MEFNKQQNFLFAIDEDSKSMMSISSSSEESCSQSSGDDSRRESFNIDLENDTVNININEQRVCDTPFDNNNNNNKAKKLFLNISNLDVNDNDNDNNQKRPPRKKKRRRQMPSIAMAHFHDLYSLTGEVLGEGSTGRVETCLKISSGVEYAVKMISKSGWGFNRAKVLKEIELYYLCQSQSQIIRLIEYFEESDYFYLVFEKVRGGQLLDQIRKRVHFTEEEASTIIKDLALALKFLHQRGIAHRDLKPENILCVNPDNPCPVKLCDFDLCSSVHQTVTTPMLQSPVGSAEYMAPEVVNAFDTLTDDDDDDQDEDELLSYDKRCDLWSLGIIAYILLCGYLPFTGHCDNPSGCEWESGGECLECQKCLFHSIKEGSLEFPEQPWAQISDEAKDLISKLLVRDASRRTDADALLRHPWILKGGSCNALDTPSVLRRQTSVKEFSEFAGSALMMKRTVENFASSVIHQQQQQQQQMKKSYTSNDLILETCSGSIVRRQSSMFFPEDLSNLRCEF